MPSDERPGDEDPRPDPAVLEIVSEPFSSVADSYERLVRLERHFQEVEDRRAVFLTIYRHITDAITTRIDDDYYFHDSDWVAEYLTTFADYYRRALLAFEERDHEDLPPPWQVAFQRAVAGDLLVVQDAFLGINAHVNYDLAYALDEIGIDPNRRAKYEDHCAVNDVLATRVDEIQTILVAEYAPGLDDLPTAIDDVAETFSLLSVEEGRQIAWENAVALSDSRFGVRAAVARWVVRTVSTGAADFVLSPNVSPELLAELREIEGGNAGPWSFADERVAIEQ